jgi:hypothetical protein
MRAKAKEYEEERGIQTMFHAIGMATWKAADGGRNPKAPVFLLPVTVSEPAKKPHLVTTSGSLPAGSDENSDLPSV